MGKYFGTDGFRGEAGITLNADHAYKIGRFLGWYYSQEKGGKKSKIVIGKDTRRSSYCFEYALCAGLTASGADAYLLHVTTTPSVSFVTRTEGFDCGIMISASHNPYSDNGIKLVDSCGEKMDDKTLEEVENYLDGLIPEAPFATGDKIGCTVDFSMGRNRYIAYLISLATRSYKDKRVGLDCANGASFMIAKAVFDALGAKTYVINNNPDGININTNCGSTHIEGLQRAVVENKLDVGFAFDGDADRCLAVDENGALVDGDAILYIEGKYLRECGLLSDDTVVMTIMNNFGLCKALEKEGLKYSLTTVGDKYIYERMVEEGYSLGGEQSGHIIFKKYATTGDGILTAIKVMEVMLEKKATLSKLCEGYVPYPQVLKNIRVTDKDKIINDEEVQAALQKATDVIGDKGRILIRKSGTEPVVRVMAEASDVKLCEEQVASIVEIINRKR